MVEIWETLFNAGVNGFRNLWFSKGLIFGILRSPGFRNTGFLKTWNECWY